MPTVTSKDGTKIAYSTWGQGPALVLVDGAFCYRENGLTPMLAEPLAEHFTVYAYDRRGRGESGDAVVYDIAREIEDLQAVVDAAGGSAFVVGFSSGGALALRAVLGGLKATKLGIFEAPFVPAEGNSPTFAHSARAIDQFVADGRRGDAVNYFMVKVFGAPGVFVFIMKWLMRASWKRNESVAHTLPHDLAILGDGSVPAEAARITVPTIVLGGEKTDPKLREAVERTAAAIPGAKLEWLAGQSHMVKPKLMVPALKRFFDETPSKHAGSRP